MSYNNNVFKFDIGDLVERVTWDAQARNMGIVVELGSDLATDDIIGSLPNELVKVLWQGGYGSFWAKTKHLKLIEKAKKNV